MKALLALVIVLGFFGVLGALFFIHDLGSETRDVLLVMLGALISAFKECVGYYMGSSSGSARKGDQIAAAAEVAAEVPTTVKIDTSEKPVAVKEVESTAKGDAHEPVRKPQG